MASVHVSDFKIFDVADNSFVAVQVCYNIRNFVKIGLYLIKCGT